MDVGFPLFGEIFVDFLVEEGYFVSVFALDMENNLVEDISF